jgi:transposase
VSKARLVITAVVVEGRKPAEVAAAYGVARSWVYELVARYRSEGEAAFEPRSRRPRTSPTAIDERTVELITELRKDLAGQGLDAGPDTIAWHLLEHHRIGVSAATVARYLTRAGLVTPEPAKRPRSSYIRFAESRTRPADAQKVAACSADPAAHDQRAADPAGHFQRAVQPPPTAPLTAPPRHPRRRLPRAT